MNRRRLIEYLSAGCSLAATPIAWGADGLAMATIGVLQTSPLTSNASARTINVLRDSLRAAGLVEGQNLKLVLRSAEGRPQALPMLASELEQLPVQVLCAFGPAAVGAAVATSRTLPIVALDLESDPLQAGWARSLNRPGGNVTGLFLNLPELAGKWLELLRELLPRLQRVGVLWDATGGSAQVNAVRQAAQRLGLRVDVHALRSVDEVAPALEGTRASGAQALALLSSPLTRNGSRQVAEFAATHRLPAISPFRAFPEAGGLMSYGPDLDYYFARTASFADKILRGANPAELPIEQPARFEFVINAGTGRALGLSISKTLLLRADNVIE